MKTRLVVFDFDGTLANAQAHFDKALIEFATLNGLPYDLQKLATGYIDPSKYDLGFGVSLADQRPILDMYHNYLMDNEERFLPDFFLGADTMLAEISSRYALGIVTLRDRSSTTAVLTRTGHGRFFPGIRTSCCARERGYPKKPAPDALQCLMREMNYAPENTVMIGDTTSDIDMARGAGARSIGVVWGAHPAERLAQSSPDLITREIAELPAAIDAVFGRK